MNQRAGKGAIICMIITLLVTEFSCSSVKNHVFSPEKTNNQVLTEPIKKENDLRESLQSTKTSPPVDGKEIPGTISPVPSPTRILDLAEESEPYQHATEEKFADMQSSDKPTEGKSVIPTSESITTLLTEGTTIPQETKQEDTVEKHADACDALSGGIADIQVPEFQSPELKTTDEKEKTAMSVPYIIVCIFLLISLFLAIRISAKRKKKLGLLERKYQDFHFADIESAQHELALLNETIHMRQATNHNLAESISVLQGQQEQAKEAYDAIKTDLANQQNEFERKKQSNKTRLQQYRFLYDAMESSWKQYQGIDMPLQYFPQLTNEQKRDLDALAPSVTLALNCMNYQELRSQFVKNKKEIDALCLEYQDRYTTKANKTIYQLVVLSLASELQNVLIKLKYSKREEGRQAITVLTDKYLAIATEGNQSIISTITRFILQIKELYMNAVDIEYQYYIKKEQIRQEQLLLREQMREEAEEQRKLKEQEELMKQEAEKYHQEMERLNKKLAEVSDATEKAACSSDLEKVNQLLSQIEGKREEIVKLQKGKAGNVYIISNLGSFGDNVFKIGMTRRLDPQERVDELGSASVPFPFDVHSFIFSDDAVGLENALHQRLTEKRVNKVNLKKEFFHVGIDEVEQLVNEIYPSAEFNKTMLAEEYQQSLSLTQPIQEYTPDEDIEEDDESGEEIQGQA